MPIEHKCSVLTHNPGTLPIAAYAEEPLSISIPVPERVLLHSFNETCNDLQEPESEASTRIALTPNEETKEQQGHYLNGEYVITSKTRQIGKVLTTYSNDRSDSALLQALLNYD